MLRKPMTEARRLRILRRDDFTCRRCGSEVEPFEIDHEIGLFFHEIDPVRWPLERLEADDNLRTLCILCHMRHTKTQVKIRAKARRIARGKEKGKYRWPTRKIPSRPFRRRPTSSI